MKKRTGGFFSAAFLTLLVWPALGADKWSLSDWLKSLDAKMKQTDQKRKTDLLAAGAIRGDKKEETASKKLYWKGKTESPPASPQELDDFKAAVTLAQTGKNAEAQKSFAAFLEKYPDSSLASDTKQTLALLKESAGPAAVVPSSAPAAGDQKEPSKTEKPAP